MARITDSRSPYTFLQQRFQYIYRHPERKFTSILENVPQWPVSPFYTLTFPTSSIGEYAPCQGQSDLIEAICTREQQQHEIALQPSNVLVTSGALYGLSLIFRELYQSCAVVLCQAPVLSNIADMFADIGYQVTYFLTPEGEIDMDWLRTNCTPEVRILYLNVPHNPMGDICPPETIQQLVDFAVERNVMLVMDMVYDSFVYNGRPAVYPFHYCDAWQNLYVVNSMSKNYGAPGLRIGWIVSAAGNIARLGARLDQECLAISGSIQEQARQLLQVDNNPLFEAARTGKQLIEQELSVCQDICLPNAQGGLQFFVKLPVDDVEAFADSMLQDYGLFFATSSHYGGAQGSYIRIPMGLPTTTLKPALSMLTDGLERMRN